MNKANLPKLLGRLSAAAPALAVAAVLVAVALPAVGRPELWQRALANALLLVGVGGLALAYWKSRSRLERLHLLVAETAGVVQPEAASSGPMLEERLHGLLAGAGSEAATWAERHEELEVANKVILYEKRRLNHLLDGLDDVVLLLDPEGKLREFNKAAENCLSLREGPVVGRPLEEAVAEERLVAFYEENAARTAGAQMEISLGRDGTQDEAWYRASLVPLTGEGGNMLGHLLQLRDITCLKMAETARNEFISHVSHELRSPLNTIRSYTEMLVDGEVAEEEQRREFFNTIQSEAARLAKLIDNLLNISKIEMGSLSLERSLVQVGRLVQSCCQTVEPQALAKGVRFEVKLPEKMPSSFLDKQMAETAFYNLLGNALKYTPEGGSVQVKVENTPEEISVHVIDTGCGIPEAELPHIFDKFFRGASEQVRSQTGNGLGLALSKKIVELHGGDLKVISREGSGSQFTMVLPVDEFRLVN